MLRRLLEEWLPGLPLLCIPGNHDVPRSLRETFPESVTRNQTIPGRSAGLLLTVPSESHVGPGGG